MRVSAPILVLAITTFLPAQNDAALAALCQQIATAIPGSLVPGKALPLPKAEVLASITALAPGAALDTAAVYAVEHAWPDDDAAEARLVRVPIGNAAGHQLVLIAATDRQMRGGAVVDKDGRLDASWNVFMAQFAGMLLPRLEGAQPTAEVDKRIAALEAGTDAAAKASAALVDMRRQMVHQQVPARALQSALEQGELPPAATIAAMRGAYAAMQMRAAALAPLLGEASKDFDKLLADVLAILDKLPNATDKQMRSAALEKLKGDCRDCHALESDRYKGELEKFTAKERRRLELGGQVFLLGYDVFADGQDAKAAQAFAAATYRAALLLGCSMK